jgi:hypothetical protein
MNKSEDKYFIILRFGAFGVSAFLWLLSVLWSADGFGIKLDGWKPAGYGLALCVTIIQLVFNRGTMIPTLYVGGIAAYLYGISTNLIGLINIIGFNLTEWSLDKIITFILILVLALVVEILPESLLLWALNPQQGSPGDFISSLLGGSGYKRNNRQNRYNSSYSAEQNRSKHQQTEQNFTEHNGTKQFPYKINWTKIGEDTNIFKVLIAYRQFWIKYGKDCPNRVLEQMTNVSKGQVSVIISKLKSGGFG